jgi:hypothetical protein
VEHPWVIEVDSVMVAANMVVRIENRMVDGLRTIEMQQKE